MNEEIKHIQERCIALMSERRLSYAELGKLTGLPKATIQRYFTKEDARIPINRLELIAKALNVPASYLLGWTDSPHHHRPSKSMTLEEFASEFGIADDLLENSFAIFEKWYEQVGVFNFDEDETKEIINFVNYLISKRRGTK